MIGSVFALLQTRIGADSLSCQARPGDGLYLERDFALKDPHVPGNGGAECLAVSIGMDPFTWNYNSCLNEHICMDTRFLDSNRLSMRRCLFRPCVHSSPCATG